MYRISKDQIAQYSLVGRSKFPSAVDINCPHCGRPVTLVGEKWISRSSGSWHISRCRCPRCKEHAHFHALAPAKIREAEGPLVNMWLYPAPKTRKPRVDLAKVDEASDGLIRAYHSAVNVVNAAEWNAAAVMCRRVLEGITKSILDEGESSAPLYKQIEALPDARDLSKPLLALADSIRKGGNLGAHFDIDEREADEETALAMLTLLEDLMEYLFVLPADIERLQERLER